jgi:hypothetical protein
MVNYPIKKGGKVAGFRSRGTHSKSSYHEPRRLVRVDHLTSVASFAMAKGWSPSEPPHQAVPSSQGFDPKLPSLITQEKWRKWVDVEMPIHGVWMNKGHSMCLVTDPMDPKNEISGVIANLRIGNKEKMPPMVIRLNETKYPNVRVGDSTYDSKLVKMAVNVLCFQGANLRFLTRAAGNEIGAITNDFGETIFIAPTFSEEPAIKLSEVK